MAQQVATQNFLIHDENGKPQVIKVVHTPSSKWQTGPSSQMSVVRTSSGIIKSSGTPVRRLYNDDDDDDEDEEPTTRSYVIQKSRPSGTSMPQTPQTSYKVVRNISYRNQTENDSSHLSLDSGSRLSLGTKRMTTLRGNPTPVKRMSPELVDPYSHDSPYTGKRGRRGEKGGKGLRHFSMKVCQKVKQKGKTTYNEVADELVSEFTGTAITPGHEQSYDQKNIRRRVYDALNVLMAMNIISKEKKEIRWLGLPSGYPKLKNPENVAGMERAINTRIATKKKTLQNLILQQVAFKNLMQRNKENEAVKGIPGPGAVIQLPMLVVSTNKNTTVNCSVSNDRKEYCFNFDDEFAIKDEGHVLQGMGMMMGLNTGDATPEDLIRAKTMIPRALHGYLEEMVTQNVSSAAGTTSMYGDDEDEGTVYLEEDDSATDDDIEGH